MKTSIHFSKTKLQAQICTKCFILLLKLCSFSLVNAECPGILKQAGDSYYFLSDDQLDPNRAQSYCSSLNGNLASIKEETVRDDVVELLNMKHIAGLQDVWVSYYGERRFYRYSKEKNVWGKWRRDEDLPRIKLYKSSTSKVYKQKIYFCRANAWWGINPPNKWLVKPFKCDVAGWSHGFSSYGSNNVTPGKRKLYNFQNNIYSSRLSTSSVIVEDYNKIDITIYIPDIRVIIGVRSDVNESDWFGNDRSMLNLKNVPKSMIGVCQQMALHYQYNGTNEWWGYSALNCTNDSAFYICQIKKFSLQAHEVKCNGSSLQITWKFDGETSSGNTNQSIQIIVNEQTYLPSITDDGLMVTGLRQRTTYHIQGDVTTRDCPDIRMSASVQGTTGYGIPDQISKAWVQNSTQPPKYVCVVSWFHNNSDENIIGYLIYGYSSVKSNNTLWENVTNLQPAITTEEEVILNHTIPLQGIKPNTSVYFKIQAYSCERRSLEKHVTGFCITPVVIPASQEEKNGNEQSIVFIIIPVAAIIIIVLLVIGIIYTRHRSASNQEIRVSQAGRPTSSRHANPPRHTDGQDVHIETEHVATQNQAIYENALTRPYEEFESGPVPAEVLLRNYIGKCANNLQWFTKEFNVIKDKSASKPHRTSQIECNAKQNRYKNIYSFDDSRVILQGNSQNDYINASFIEGYKGKNKFIATQGPKNNTIADFWRMIWEQKSSIIVMLCNLKEKEKVKCAHYWPQAGSKKLFGDFKVGTITEDRVGGIICRTFLLSNVASEKNSHETESKSVQQFHFVSWPDQGVPKTTSQLMYLYRMVKDAASANSKSPVVVHCSAGAGRTGTFIAMNILFDELEDTGKVDALSAVLKMRENRKDMVQTLPQYIYMNKLVVEHHVFGNTDIFSAQFEYTTSQSDWRQKLQNEFVNLSVIPNTPTCEVANSHREQNVDADCVP